MLTGCGKSREEKEFEALLEDDYDDIEKQLDQIKEDQSPAFEDNLEMIEDIGEDDFDGDAPAPVVTKKDGEDKPKIEEEKTDFKLVEVSEEVKNSKLTDEIVQVGNVVLPNDMSLTVQDVMDLLSADQGPVKIHPNQYAVDGLYTSSTGEWLGIYPDEEGSEKNSLNEICELYVFEEPDDPKRVVEHKVLDIHGPGFPGSMNVFYPGNICAAYGDSIDFMEKGYCSIGKYRFENEIKQRNDERQFLEMTFEDGKALMEKLALDAGLECKWSEKKDNCIIEYIDPDVIAGRKSPIDGNENVHRVINYNMKIDMNKNKVWKLEVASGTKFGE